MQQISQKKVIENPVLMFDLQNNYLNEDDPWAGIITDTDVDIQTFYHNKLQSMTIQLVLELSMIIKPPFVDYWGYVRRYNQELMDQNNKNKIKITNQTIMGYVKNYKCDTKNQTNRRIHIT